VATKQDTTTDKPESKAIRQDPYPVGDPRRKDKSKTRVCTCALHVGKNPLPATPEYFPVRKSGPKEGTFIGWCGGSRLDGGCQKRSAARHRDQIERQGVRGGRTEAQKAEDAARMRARKAISSDGGLSKSAKAKALVAAGLADSIKQARAQLADMGEAA
jgi:hypothetical protein